MVNSVVFVLLLLVLLLLLSETGTPADRLYGHWKVRSLRFDQKEWDYWVEQYRALDEQNPFGQIENQ